MIQKPIGIHSFMNETLEAITQALSIEQDDRVISICSCGAQPLAFLQYLGNGRILAIDNNPKQINFAKQVIQIIKQGKNLKELNLAPKDGPYFSNKHRLEAITQNLNRLQFKLMDVTKKPETNRKFTKGYFSNADVNLKYIHPIFEDGALIYVAFATHDLPKDIEKFLDNRSEAYRCDIRKLYEIDMPRTRLACKIESAHPCV